jgi:hypothetical protein
MIKSLEQRFPVPAGTHLRQWDLLVTTASVFVALTRLNHEPLPASCVNSICDIVTRNLRAWRQDALPAFDNCKSFYDRTMDAGQLSGPFQSADAVGAWVIFGLLGRPPITAAEAALPRAIGALVVEQTRGWWSA